MKKSLFILPFLIIVTACAGDDYTERMAREHDGDEPVSNVSSENMQQAMGNPETAIENLNAAIDYLKSERSADRLGVIGWCFGGAWSLNISLASADEIDATIIYYGHLETDPVAISDLNHPVLGIFGEEDEGISVESALEFEAALQEIGVEHEIHIYENANHAFANPSGINYNAEAAEDAWAKTTSFLGRTLRGEL